MNIKEQSLQNFTDESIEARQQRQDKQKSLMLSYLELDKKGEKLPDSDVRWLLGNVLFLPNEKPGAGVLPKGNLRNKPLSSAALQQAVNVYFGNMAQSGSTERELLVLLQDFHPDRLSVLFQKAKTSLKVRESISKLQSLVNFFTQNNHKSDENVTVNTLRQQMSHMVYVVLSLNIDTDIHDKSVYHKKQMQKLAAEFPQLYEVDTIRGLFQLLLSLTISITRDGEDLFRSVLPKKKDKHFDAFKRKFTKSERQTNFTKLIALQSALSYFNQAICKEAGINQFNLHWFIDSYLKYLYTLKGRLIYEIYCIKYAEGTALEAILQQLWKTLKMVNFLLKIKDQLVDFKKLSRELRDPKFRLNIMEGPTMADMKNAINLCKRKIDFNEKEPDTQSFFMKGMQPNDLINMLMKQAILFARISYLKKYAKQIAEIMSGSLNEQVKLLGRRIEATILETDFKYKIACSGAVKGVSDVDNVSDMFYFQIVSTELKRTEIEQKEQLAISKKIFLHCCETIEKYALNIPLNSQSTIDPFRKIVWIIDYAMILDLLDLEYIKIILEKAAPYLKLMKKNNQFSIEANKLGDKGELQKINLHERFSALADKGLKLVADLKTKYTKLSKQIKEVSPKAPEKTQTTTPKRRLSDSNAQPEPQTPKLFKNSVDDDFDL